MLGVLNKLICFTIMSTTGFYIIKIITKSNVKLLSKHTISYLFLQVLIQICLYKVQYTMTYTLTVFLLNIITYKGIFKLKLENAVISCSIFTVILFFSDLILSTTVGIVVSPEEARGTSIIAIQTNSLIALLTYIIADTRMVRNKIQQFYINVTKKKMLTNVLFFILIIIDFSYIAYNLLENRNHNIEFLGNFTAMAIFTIVVFIFIENKNSYNQLSDEYDNLFSYVQNFEDWIEKEQLNRHEYKNQLAVIRSVSKEKKVKEKIDDILEDNINIESNVVHKLKELPKGGLKGLMYYKVAIAQKHKLKIEVDVSIDNNSPLNKLTEEKNKVLCKLIGIYLDNAIEAAIGTKKKNILLEIYEQQNKVNIVISNSFNENIKMDKRNERGVTTKGEGRGNGLFFANRLVSKNNWLSTNQQIIDDYYIQTLTIKN